MNKNLAMYSEIFRKKSEVDERCPMWLAEAFYHHCRQEERQCEWASQLILIEGEELKEWTQSLFLRIYQDYNYATVITKRPDAWEATEKEAFQEYGLQLRCVEDRKKILFPERCAIIMDFGGKSPLCLRSLPQDSFYMDLNGDGEKSIRIQKKCKGIPYVSLRNTLDTIWKDNV